MTLHFEAIEVANDGGASDMAGFADFTHAWGIAMLIDIRPDELKDRSG